MGQLNAWKICAGVLSITLAGPALAFAQVGAGKAGEPRASLAGGYVFLQQEPAGGLESPIYRVGWMATGAFRLGSGRLSAVGEAGLSHRTTTADERQELFGVFGGARFAVYSARHVTLFAQGLVGLERFSEPGLVESSMAVQPGAGLDVLLSRRLFLRAQADYRWSQPNDATFHAYRIVAAFGVRMN